jgi:uncharacterized protein YjiS (DUF1127 family)
MKTFALAQVRLQPLGWAAHIGRALSALAVAIRVSSERRALRALDERSLKDIGASQSAAWAEAHRRFWDVPGARLQRERRRGQI